MKKNIKIFSMVEILLAMFVIAVGMTSILGIFPIGLDASRDSKANNFASQEMESLINFMILQANNSWSTYIDSDTLSTKPSPTSESSKGSLADSNFPTIFKDNTVANKGVYWVYSWQDQEVVANNTLNIGTDIVDFSGVARVWKSKLTTAYTSSTPYTPTTSTTSACMLHIELSWPAIMPYERRQKAYFNMEIFKP